MRDPDTELFEIEAVLREAAARSYLIADGAGFRIVIGMQAWIAELDRLGRTPERTEPHWRASQTARISPSDHGCLT